MLSPSRRGHLPSWQRKTGRRRPSSRDVLQAFARVPHAFGGTSGWLRSPRCERHLLCCKNTGDSGRTKGRKIIEKFKNFETRRRKLESDSEVLRRYTKTRRKGVWKRVCRRFPPYAWVWLVRWRASGRLRDACGPDMCASQSSSTSRFKLRICSLYFSDIPCNRWRILTWSFITMYWTCTT